MVSCGEDGQRKVPGRGAGEEKAAIVGKNVAAG